MDRQWSQNLVLASLCFIAGAAIIALDLFVQSADDIGHVGIGLVVLGNVFHNRELACRLREREQAAYDLGRDTIRSVR